METFNKVDFTNNKLPIEFNRTPDKINITSKNNFDINNDNNMSLTGRPNKILLILHIIT